MDAETKKQIEDMHELHRENVHKSQRELAAVEPLSKEDKLAIKQQRKIDLAPQQVAQHRARLKMMGVAGKLL